MELTEADLKEEEQLDPKEQLNTQVSICPLRQSLLSHRSESQKMYYSDEELCRGLCRAEPTEAWMRHLSQRQTLQAAKLEEQDEAEEQRSHDDVEDQRTLRQYSPLSGEKPPEETADVRGTCMKERDENHKQLLLGRNRSHPWEQLGHPASPEEDDESSRSQPA